MAITYGTATFEMEVDDRQGFRPHWQRESHYERRHIHGSNTDDVQFSGLGNERLTIPIYVESDSAMATLLGYRADGIARTLSNPFGDSATYTNVYLVEITGVQRQTFAARWMAQAIFEKVSP